jgi:hypothetical protein
MHTLPVLQVSQGKEIEVTARLPTITGENKIIPNAIVTKLFSELVANVSSLPIVNTINMQMGRQERCTRQCVWNKRRRNRSKILSNRITEIRERKKTVCIGFRSDKIACVGLTTRSFVQNRPRNSRWYNPNFQNNLRGSEILGFWTLSIFRYSRN